MNRRIKPVPGAEQPRPPGGTDAKFTVATAPGAELPRPVPKTAQGARLLVYVGGPKPLSARVRQAWAARWEPACCGGHGGYSRSH